MSYLPYKVTALARSDNGDLNIIPGATVTVLNSTGGYATLREADLTTPILNPFNCDENGERQIYLQGGSYTFSVDGGQSWEVRLSGASDIQSVATIADLRAIEPATNGQQAETLGHTLPGVGAGKYYYDAGDTVSTDNNFTTIVTPGGRRWKLKQQEWYSVEQAGVLGGGVVDDYAAMQIAVRSVPNLKLRGGEIYLLNSQLEIDRTIKITADEPATFLAGHGNYVARVTADNVEINNLTIDINQLASTGMRVTGVAGFRGNNLEIRNRSTTVTGYNGGLTVIGCTDAKIQGAKFLDIPLGLDTIGHAFAFNNSSHCHANDLYFNNVPVAVSISTGCRHIYINGVEATNVDDNSFYILEDNRFVFIENVDLYDVDKGFILDCIDEAANVFISNFSIENCASRAIGCRKGGGYYVSEGVIKNAGFTGVSPIDQNTGDGPANNIHLSNIEVIDTPSRRPIDFIGNNGVYLNNVWIKGGDPAGTGVEAARFTNCDNVHINGGGVVVGTAPWASNYRFESGAATVVNPVININSPVLDRNVTDYVLNVGDDNITIRDGWRRRSWAVHSRLADGSDYFAPSGWTLVNESQGVYLITHNLGLSVINNLAVTATIIGATAGTANCEIVDGNSFRVRTFNTSFAATNRAFFVNVAWAGLG